MAINDPDTPVMTQDVPEGAIVREGEYGTRVVAVEPGGAEFIPLHERHGSPLQLFWTWVSPNMEFATIFVGVLGVAAFGMSFWQTVLAILLGSALGGLSQGLLSQQGPLFGVPQMVLSRLGFGYWGNVLPAGLNSITAGICWFAVNSVSATFALNTLTHLAKPACLVIVVLLQVVVAFFGYNLVHVFERYAFPVLTIIFLIASVVVLSKAHPGAPHKTIPGAFLIEVGATFGYAVGWNPYASDYTRYMKPTVNKTAVAWWAFLGLFLSCVLLETAGAAAMSAASKPAIDPGVFTGLMPTWLGKLVLLCIAHDPRVRMRDIAGAVDITERAAQRIVAELIEFGYITRTREGRRNRYAVRTDLPLVLPTARDLDLGSLLTVLVPAGSSDERRGLTAAAPVAADATAA